MIKTVVVIFGVLRSMLLLFARVLWAHGGRRKNVGQMMRRLRLFAV